ncbi:hypothetical protein F2Q69_00042142 [Brassica cretica]|uniref:Uncharacterized protein n=1 Tax=Brassica cretica TaxID=69181 RepID=A0A8S9N2W4_BRACR|nr:hypothetical protein F2Q69_00042142 [Brassica cretica]
MTHRSDKEEKLDLLADVTHRSNKKEVHDGKDRTHAGRQNLGGRVYALGVENPDNAGPSSGPITGIGCLTSSVY